MIMNLKVNKDKCIGCGQCVSLCEEVFDFDDDNFHNGVPFDINKPVYCSCGEKLKFT